MELITTYYCIKAAISIGKFALDYQKVQMTNDTNRELTYLKYLNESIHDYICLIRPNIQSLMHMYFRSAYENLVYAISANPDCKREYLVQARNRFIDACTIEKNDNLLLAYLGLSLCQKLLDDCENSVKTLNRIKTIEWEDIYSNNADIVLKDWDSLWWRILTKIGLSMSMHMSLYSTNKNNAHDIIDYELSWYHDNDQLIDYKKHVYYRRIDALKQCGGFSFNEKEFSNNCVNAEKFILKENFTKIKQEVIDTFHL